MLPLLRLTSRWKSVTDADQSEMSTPHDRIGMVVEARTVVLRLHILSFVQRLWFTTPPSASPPNEFEGQPSICLDMQMAPYHFVSRQFINTVRKRRSCERAAFHDVDLPFMAERVTSSFVPALLRGNTRNEIDANWSFGAITK